MFNDYKIKIKYNNKQYKFKSVSDFYTFLFGKFRKKLILKTLSYNFLTFHAISPFVIEMNWVLHIMNIYLAI